MKQITYIIVACFFLNGCGEKVDSRKYIIDNGTAYKIKIELYTQYSSVPRSFEKIGIGAVHTAVMDDEQYEINAPSAFGTDSVVVTYNDLKRQVYWISETSFESLPQVTRNLLNDFDYSVLEKGNYIFTFSEEDYENAEKL
jgi:hypothetical protein